MIFVPQFPTSMRYQEWWLTEFTKAFDKYFDEVVVLGWDRTETGMTTRKHLDMFAPVDASIQYELNQMKEYSEMKIYNDDIMFISDLSFPGMFPAILYHKMPHRVFMFCHATSMNTLDYFELFQGSKYLVERGYGAMCDMVFVGSKYHAKKISNIGNTCVTYLPYPPFKSTVKPFEEREHTIVSVSRPTPQKVNLEKERMIEQCFDTTIVRQEFKDWQSYYDFLGNSKCLLLTSCEETFGYQVVDAVISGCIPVAPHAFSYPELLPAHYLYLNDSTMISLVSKAITDQAEVPSLICHREMSKFFETIIHMMKG
jgi:hypothetical protein